MSAIVSQITSLTIVYSTVYSGADQRKHQSSASLSFGIGIHRWPVNSPHEGPVTRKMFPFDDVFMLCQVFFFKFITAPYVLRDTYEWRIQWQQQFEYRNAATIGTLLSLLLDILHIH